MQLAELVLQRAATLTSTYNNFYPYLAAISRGSNFKPLYNIQLIVPPPMLQTITLSLVLNLV
jgi:hypothetical protein